MKFCEKLKLYEPKFLKTSTFISHVAPLDAEIESLMNDISRLAGTIESKKLANAATKLKKDMKKYKAEEIRLSSCKKRLQVLKERRERLERGDTSEYTWQQLLEMLVYVDGHVWTERQKELGEKLLERYEGRFEASYRDHMGWPISASLDLCDFPDGSEGKELSVEGSFRSGKTGKTAFGVLLRSMARQFNESDMSAEQWDTLFDGEVSASKVYHSFPEPVRRLIQRDLSPDRVLSMFTSMVFFTELGCFRVCREDYPDAFSLVAVTQMKPKYRIKREYVEKRIRSLKDGDLPFAA